MSDTNESSRLLVPIHIDALMVGTSLPDRAIFQWTNLAPDFSKLRKGEFFFFGSELDGNAGDPFFKASGLESGIHLHFRLPRALKHGSQTGTGDVIFPAIPNRWLVQRFVGSDSLAYKAWLLQSDVETNGPAPGVTWPTFQQDGLVKLARIGTVTELTAPLADENRKADPRITAVGQGNPSFSAYYPACRGLLGFWDSLADIKNVPARVSYFVTGWYSDSEDDPLYTAEFRQKYSDPQGAMTEAQRKEQLADLQAWAKDRGWIVTEDSPPRLNSPSRLLCHGLVRGIVWAGPDQNYRKGSGGEGDVFPPSLGEWKGSYQLAIGNTAAEALAALLAPGEVDQDLLTALQGETLNVTVPKRLSLSAGILVDDAFPQYELHQRRFRGTDGGTVYLIRPEPDPDEPVAQAVAGPPSNRGASPIPAALREILRELNVKQEALDRLSRRKEDCRWLVYAEWFLWISELRQGITNENKEKVALLDEQLKTAKEALAAERATWNSAKQARDLVRQQLDAALTKFPWTEPDGTPKLRGEGADKKIALQYRLESAAAQSFQRPTDPVIAVAGPAMVMHNSWSSGRMVNCRISGQEVSGITLQVPAGPIASITGEDLAKTLFADDWKSLPVPEGSHHALILEALLLDGQNASRIAKMASEPNQVDLTKIVKALQNDTAVQPPDPNKLIGKMPDPAATVNRGTGTNLDAVTGNPWVPLFLVWKASWQSDYRPPAKGALPEKLVIERWGLSGSGDLVPAPGVTTPPDKRAFYQGYSILTPTAVNDLAKRLEALNESHPLVNVLKNMGVQSQMLDGFTDALTLQQPGMQLPPLDFEAWLNSEGEDYRLDPIYKIINDGFDEKRDTFRTAPLASDDPFLPVRAGRLKIEKLSIVDAFGQTLILPVDEINASLSSKTWKEQRLRRAHSLVATPQDGSTTLRPRFAQPMRLRFEWANASANGGPVCGWILPNHLEKSFMVYSATGKPLGALQQKLGLGAGSRSRGFYWVQVPGVDGTDIKNIENTYLRNFCTWISLLRPDDGGLLSDFINVAVDSTDKRVPDEDPGVAVLVGRPLALVRASLQFETAGLPAHPPTLLPGPLGQNGVDDKIVTSDFERVEWPLRLGDIDARDDGLIGIFQGPGEAENPKGVFYPTWGKDEPKPPKQDVFAVQDFKIDCVHPLQVTMLIDPQARIHATTGTLPRTSLELPPEDVTGARRARDVFFQTAPLLGLSDTPQMPRPSDDYGEWSWAFRPDVTHWKLDPTIVDATDRANFSNLWPAIAEGWLKLEIALVKVLSFWVKEPGEAFDPGTRIHLAWSLQGAESLKLEQIKDRVVTLLDKWNAPPFPREYPVTVEADTVYRITASAEYAPASSQDVTVKVN